MFDTVIKNGTAVIDGRAAPADVAISGERIVAIAERGTVLPARNVVDAADMLVLPGAIDPHVARQHVAAPLFFSIRPVYSFII